MGRDRVNWSGLMGVLFVGASWGRNGKCEIRRVGWGRAG